MKKVLGLLVIFAQSLFAGYAQSLYNVETKMNENKWSEALVDLLPLIEKEKSKEKMKPQKVAELYKMAATCKVQIFNAELMKAAQQLPLDTALFISALDEVVDYCTKSHEYDMMPNKKGEVKPKYLPENKKMMMALLDFYNYAGQFANENGDKALSIRCFEDYTNMPQNPLFTKEETDSIYASKQQYYTMAAFNVAFINYQMKDWDGVLRNAEKALRDTLYLNDLYVMKAHAYLEKKDTASWIGTLKEAIGRLENPSAFMQQLLFYYVDKNNLAEAEAMAEDLVSKNPNNKAAWYMKGCVALNLEKNFEEARTALQKSLEIDPDYADANYNMGVSYINEVIALRDKGEFCLDRTKVDQFNADRKRIQEYYRKALPYFEKVQALVPDQPRKWAPTLQQIYYNLDNNPKAQEMDEIMRNAQ